MIYENRAGIFELSCDFCGRKKEYLFFDTAKDGAKEDGWKIIFDNGFHNFCDKCQKDPRFSKYAAGKK